MFDASWMMPLTPYVQAALVLVTGTLWGLTIKELRSSK